MVLEGARSCFPSLLTTTTSILSLALFIPLAVTQPYPSVLQSRAIDPLIQVVSSPPNTSRLPAQIGGIFGAYALSLVLVAIGLIILSKRRREHINSGDDEVDFAPNIHEEIPLGDPDSKSAAFELDLTPLAPPAQNYSYPTPTKSEFSIRSVPSLTINTTQNVAVSPVGCPGKSPLVDQRVVEFDKAMAQSQLEEMYKHVLKHEAAKKRGEVYEAPTNPGSSLQPASSPAPSVSSFASVPSRRERSKPSSLNFSQPAAEDRQSKAPSFLSSLVSPRKKAFKGVNISSPMMTPQSATFPRFPESQEMNAMLSRQYAPAPPPPVPTDRARYGAPPATPRTMAPVTPPDASPESTQSIDERIGKELPAARKDHYRKPSDIDPVSATSEHSLAPLVGLPSTPKAGSRFPSLPASPKPGSTFPALPASPKPGATFSRANKPSAVRTGGSLPFRAYESEATPSEISQTTKQTVFERRGPLSPSGNQTPFTAGVPYTPYQPYTPCVPMTPTLVTKQDRKRMKRLVPMTPTMEMVKPPEEIW